MNEELFRPLGMTNSVDIRRLSKDIWRLSKSRKTAST